MLTTRKGGDYIHTMPQSAFGNYLREKRIKNKMTLRAFCNRYGFDPAYISRLENSRLKPPSKEKLTVIADALGFVRNSVERVKFFDLAHLARSEYPNDIKNNADDALSLLPAFLRTRDGKKVDRKNVKKLIRFLEKKQNK